MVFTWLGAEEATVDDFIIAGLLPFPQLRNFSSRNPDEFCIFSEHVRITPSWHRAPTPSAFYHMNFKYLAFGTNVYIWSLKTKIILYRSVLGILLLTVKGYRAHKVKMLSQIFGIPVLLNMS